MLSSGSSVGVGALQNMTSTAAGGASGGGAQQSYSGASGGIVTGSIEAEYASDLAASGGFFQADYKKHEDLKQMLDSNKDHLKLEAMKRIITMVAKGRDASDLFAAVVKNVVSKNIEVKKLVYAYLVRYAEEQQDLALLSISTFQRALKDPNQLIRAGALRVLSSIRVSMIVPIVMLAIRESASDMSPYVRKTAAHAIPKLFGLDAEQKDELIDVIEKLLADRTTLVVGSAVMAFTEVCPERVDLIHKNYRKLCNLLVDVDEWGQIIIINMLTRYARTQFVDPNRDDYADLDGADAEKPFYEESASEDDVAEAGEDAAGKTPKKVAYQLDADHRLLLRQTKPLLQSRNASVVMSVVQLYHHIAPRNEIDTVAKALIRLLRSHKEVQSVVLTSIASMSTQRKSIFDPFVRSFFVRTSDATHIKLLKLEILTNLANGASIALILREFQTYINSNDREFVAATIQAIGRCAASIREVTERCLSGLVHLLSNRDEYVVAESVVVIKQLLQTKVADHFDIIRQMAKLLDFITVAAARASILWLLGEYSEKVPRIAPDVLRKMAKSFVDEEDIVKLQVLNLAVKLYLTNAQQTELLCQYVFSLARYDGNYDIRDRARFLRPFVVEPKTALSRRAREIFLAAKPAPMLQSKYGGREQFQLGSLSHYLNMRASGYQDLPEFPELAPDSSVRHVESPVTTMATTPQAGQVEELAGGAIRKTKSTKAGKKADSFYSESEKSSSYCSSSDSSSSDEESEKNAATDENSSAAPKKLSNDDDGTSSDSESDSSSSSSSDDEDGSGSESSSDEEDDQASSSSSEAPAAKPKPTANQQAIKPISGKSNLDLLLELDDIAPAGPIMTPSLGGFLTPGAGLASIGTLQRIEPIGPSHVPLATSELLSALSGNGLSVRYRFTRAPHLFSGAMATVELTLVNTLDRPLNDVRLDVPDSSGPSVRAFESIAALAPGATRTAIIGIDFNDSTQPVPLTLAADAAQLRVQLRPNVGDLVRSVRMDGRTFDEERAKVRGMNEHSASVQLPDDLRADRRALQQRIFEYANVARIARPDDDDSDVDRLCLAGQTLGSHSLLLIVLEVPKAAERPATLSVSCEKMVIGSMALNELRARLLSA